MIPDIEKVVGDYLRQNTELDELGTRVVASTPRQRTTSWIRMTMLDAAAPPNSRAEHLIAYLLQLDCYAGDTGIEGSTAREANLLARTARQALHEMPGTHNGAVITSVRFIGMPRIPDTDYEPARERVVLTALVHAHAT